MFNIIVVADDHDESIGDNCKLSLEHLSKEVEVATYNACILIGDRCIPAKVHEAIMSFNNEKFILIAYSHGQAHALVSTYAKNGYVTLENAALFKESLIYTNSCLTGLKLMQVLVQHECSGYVGYTGKVRVPDRREDELVFIACENKGLINFLTTNDTLSESIEVMRKFYEEKAKEFRSKKRYFIAGRLQTNLGYLVHYDQNSIRRGDFLVDFKQPL